MKSSFPHELSDIFEISLGQEFFSIGPTFLEKSFPQFLFFFGVVDFVDLPSHFMFFCHFAYNSPSLDVLDIFL